MGDAVEKPHISPSQLDMFSRCQYQWYRRYVEKQIIPPGVALMTGTGFHAGIEINGRQKMETYRDLSVSEIQEAAVAGFENESKGGCILTPEEESVGVEKVLGKAKDQVATLAGVYAREMAPEYQPVSVEHRVRLALPNASHDLVGVVDLIDDQETLVDFKTSGRKKPQGDADVSPQLTTYAAVYQSQHGHPPKRLCFDVAVKTKTPYRQVLETCRTVRDFQVLINRVNAMLAAIKTGIFSPALPGSWWCSKRFCGYATNCPYFYGKD